MMQLLVITLLTAICLERATALSFLRAPKLGICSPKRFEKCQKLALADLEGTGIVTFFGMKDSKAFQNQTNAFLDEEGIDGQMVLNAAYDEFKRCLGKQEGYCSSIDHFRRKGLKLKDALLYAIYYKIFAFKITDDGNKYYLPHFDCLSAAQMKHPEIPGKCIKNFMKQALRHFSKRCSFVKKAILDCVLESIGATCPQAQFAICKMTEASVEVPLPECAAEIDCDPFRPKVAKVDDLM